MRKPGFSLFVLSLMYLGACTYGWASTFTINTGSPNTSISTFGYPNTATYGQTMTAVPVNTQLDSFSFSISTGGTITHRVFVMPWDGSKATGPILFQSGDQVASGGMTQYTYNTGGIVLSAGSEYVIFASVSLNYVPTNGAASLRAPL